MLKTIEYKENNSGGYWWLDDEDWNKLEEKGFTVDRDWRRATIEVESIRQAQLLFELATGQDPDEPGCECCGQPHNFYEE